MREPKYWSCSEGDEMLEHETVDEAVEDLLGGLRELPEQPFRVFGYAPLELPTVEQLAEHIVISTLEFLDEEYADPDEGTADTPAIREAARALAEVIRSDYAVWQHECVTTVEVDAAEWVKKNRPDWLTAKEADE